MSDGGARIVRQVSEKGRQVVHNVVSCAEYGDHFQNKSLLTRRAGQVRPGQACAPMAAPF